MRLDNTSENVYENELKGNILCGDVAKNGNTALATLSGDKLCNVTVYNKSLDKKMSYDLDYGYIIDIAIAELRVSLLLFSASFGATVQAGKM